MSDGLWRFLADKQFNITGHPQYNPGLDPEEISLFMEWDARQVDPAEFYFAVSRFAQDPIDIFVNCVKEYYRQRNWKVENKDEIRQTGCELQIYTSDCIQTRAIVASLLPDRQLIVNVIKK